MPGIAATDSPRRLLDLRRSACDLLRRLRGLVGQRLDLAGDHGEALAGLARARRLDRRVQRQQIGLAAIWLISSTTLADAFGGPDQAANLGIGGRGPVHRHLNRTRCTWIPAARSR